MHENVSEKDARHSQWAFVFCLFVLHANHLYLYAWHACNIYAWRVSSIQMKSELILIILWYFNNSWKRILLLFPTAICLLFCDRFKNSLAEAFTPNIFCFFFLSSLQPNVYAMHFALTNITADYYIHWQDRLLIILFKCVEFANRLKTRNRFFIHSWCYLKFIKSVALCNLLMQLCLLLTHSFIIFYIIIEVVFYSSACVLLLQVDFLFSFA